MVDPIELVDKKDRMRDRTYDKSDESAKEDLTRWETKAEVVVETPRSRHIRRYLKHEINKKLIEGLVDNQKYNDSLATLSPMLRCNADSDKSSSKSLNVMA
nr:hypothetical protein [Tanacetum cinerariifolium]